MGGLKVISPLTHSFPEVVHSFIPRGGEWTRNCSKWTKNLANGLGIVGVEDNTF